MPANPAGPSGPGRSGHHGHLDVEPGRSLRAVEAGANDFIAKPVEKTELKVRSASLLKLKEAQDALRRHQTHLEAIVQERTASLRSALEQMAEAQRVAYLAQLDTVERLAIVAETRISSRRGTSEE